MNFFDPAGLPRHSNSLFSLRRAVMLHVRSTQLLLVLLRTRPLGAMLPRGLHADSCGRLGSWGGTHWLGSLRLGLHTRLAALLARRQGPIDHRIARSDGSRLGSARRAEPRVARARRREDLAALCGRRAGALSPLVLARSAVRCITLGLAPGCGLRLDRAARNDGLMPQLARRLHVLASRGSRISRARG